MKIEIFGTGCAKCKATKEHIELVLRENDFAADLVEVDEMDEIVERGVMMTPAVAIDGDVKISGRVPTQEEIEQLLGI
ncbi:MAG: TM0996/MTH895 family glutaredoxin-like protein [Candidatus Thorarchaeota archaeon]|nr:TM0996/MTH895 family glutaredoxin-like protein [Candidatus Thorarchaeota archaeon]